MPEHKCVRVMSLLSGCVFRETPGFPLITDTSSSITYTVFFSFKQHLFLGPLFFSIFTQALGNLIQSHHVHGKGSQIYISNSDLTICLLNHSLMAISYSTCLKLNYWLSYLLLPYSKISTSVVAFLISDDKNSFLLLKSKKKKNSLEVIFDSLSPFFKKTFIQFFYKLYYILLQTIFSTDPLSPFALLSHYSRHSCLLTAHPSGLCPT